MPPIAREYPYTDKGNFVFGSWSSDCCISPFGKKKKIKIKIPNPKKYTLNGMRQPNEANHPATSIVIIPPKLLKAELKPIICVRSEEHTSELQSRFDLVC